MACAASSCAPATSSDREPAAAGSPRCSSPPGGHWDADGTQFAAAIRGALRAADPCAKQPAAHAFPWWAVALGSPFVPLLREMKEMRHLREQPIRLDNTRLRELLGTEPHTPLDEAVHQTLAGLGCLAASRAAPAALVP